MMAMLWACVNTRHNDPGKQRLGCDGQDSKIGGLCQATENQKIYSSTNILLQQKILKINWPTEALANQPLNTLYTSILLQKTWKNWPTEALANQPSLLAILRRVLIWMVSASLSTLGLAIHQIWLIPWHPEPTIASRDSHQLLHVQGLQNCESRNPCHLNRIDCDSPQGVNSTPNHQSLVTAHQNSM